MRRVRSIFAALFVCAGLPMVPGGIAQEPRLGRPPAVIRSTTRLVQVTVVAQDKKGNLVTDLTRDDFLIEDNGNPQEIRFFSFRRTERASLSAAPPPPGVFSNRHPEKARLSGGVTVILLDGLNTSWGDQAVVRPQVIKFLNQIQPEDRIALYALGRSLKVLHDYTEEPKALAKALSLYLGRSSSELMASFQPSIEQITVMAEDMAATPADVEQAVAAIQGVINTLKEEEFLFQEVRILTTLGAFEAIANHVAGVPGRKNLLWVSGSFPLQLGYFERPDNDRGRSPEMSGAPNSARFGSTRPRRGPDPGLVQVKHGRSRTFEDELTRTVRALNAANLSVYPVDARGLSSNPLVSQNISTMKVLAADTGGKAYYSTNDIMNSIREAVADTEATYTLAYYPNEQKLDGRYHEIKVRVKRSELVLRHRRGYLDSAETATGEDADRAAVEDAVWSPLDSTGVMLDARVTPAGSGELMVNVKVDPASITLEAKGDRYCGKLEFFSVQTDDQGNEHESTQQTVTMELLPATFARVSREGYVYSNTIPKHGSATSLRVVVRDVPAGKIGRVVIPFDKLPK